MPRIILHPLPSQGPQKPRRRFLPYRSFLPVRESIVRRTIWPFVALAFVLGGGSFAWAAQGLDRIGGFLNGAGLLDQWRSEPTLLLWAAILSAFSLLLLVLILSKVMDALIVFSTARYSLITAALYVVCVLFRQPEPASAVVGLILLGFSVLAVVVALAAGPAGEDWRFRAYGDVFLELVAFLPFLFLVWKPFASTTHVARLVELVAGWIGLIPGLS